MKKEIVEVHAFPEVVCPVCGKVFIPAVQHIYRDKRTPYKRVCSWGCVCKSERLKEQGIKPKRGDAK